VKEVLYIIIKSDGIEQTLVLIKPDGLKNKNVGRVITRIEDKGLKIEAMKMLWVDKELAEKHYFEHKEKEFFPRLLKYLTSGPIIAMIISGLDAIKLIRNLAGDTDPLEAKPGSIRGDFAVNIEQGNVIHASDSQKSAQREIELYFMAEEIYSY